VVAGTGPMALRWWRSPSLLLPSWTALSHSPSYPPRPEDHWEIVDPKETAGRGIDAFLETALVSVSNGDFDVSIHGSVDSLDRILSNPQGYAK